MGRPAVLSVTLPALFLLGTALTASGVSAAPAAPLPALPGPSTAPAGGAAAPASGPTEVNGFTAEQVRRGVVQVEQDGRPIGVGTVLLKDGRVLTALSALANGDAPTIRYSDGSVVKTKVGHKDKSWDLALLIPQTGKWIDGLVPTDSDPQGADLRAFVPKAGKLAPSPVGVKGRVDAKSKDGESLRSALELDLKGNPNTPGAPLIDGNGRVVGIMARACKDAGSGASTPPSAAAPAGGAAPPCSATTIGVPVYALRSFLIKTPANAVQPAPWLGLGGAPVAEGNVKGVKVMGVAPGSPAEKGGLKGGAENPDIIVAVDGQPVETPEMLAEAIAKRAIGQQVKLLVFSAGKFREAAVTLRSAP